jgi:hypothetical protein
MRANKPKMLHVILTLIALTTYHHAEATSYLPFERSSALGAETPVI